MVDGVEGACLKAILFCNSGERQLIRVHFFAYNLACNGISQTASRLVEEERDLQAKCLLQYCRQRFGSERGAARFASLIGLTDLYINIANKYRYFHFFMKVSHLVGSLLFQFNKVQRFWVNVNYHTLLDTLVG